MRHTYCLVLLSLVAGCARPSTRAIARLTAESEVRMAERQRFEAMMKRDVAALDTLLDDELIYIHPGVPVQSRSEFIDGIKKQKLVYDSIAPSEVRVRIHVGIALVTGKSHMRVRSRNGVSSYGVRFTEIYIRRAGQWLLAAWGASRVRA
ncbi:MAG: nuclear transport factor 2 family protein [Gemmatimonadaceae bacterium]